MAELCFFVTKNDIVVYLLECDAINPVLVEGRLGGKYSHQEDAVSILLVTSLAYSSTLNIDRVSAFLRNVGKPVPN
jgi:hypothetical protein